MELLLLLLLQATGAPRPGAAIAAWPTAPTSTCLGATTPTTTSLGGQRMRTTPSSGSSGGTTLPRTPGTRWAPKATCPGSWPPCHVRMEIQLLLGLLLELFLILARNGRLDPVFPRLRLGLGFFFLFLLGRGGGKGKKKKKRESRRCFPGVFTLLCFQQEGADISKHPKIAVFVRSSKQTFGYHGFGGDPFSFRASQSTGGGLWGIQTALSTAGGWKHGRVWCLQSMATWNGLGWKAA